MSDKIGMNHTHIDFHKGTHGYPIKNADDMMKPCPLMPDGIWEKVQVKITKDENGVGYGHVVNWNENSYIRIMFGNYALNGTPWELPSGTNIFARISSVGEEMVRGSIPKCPYVFGECRCSYDCDETTFTRDYTLQTSPAWLVSVHIQQYAIGTTALLSSMSNDSEVLITLYAYLTESEYIEMGDE